MAIIFAITGKAQTPLAENFSSSTFPPTGWTKLTGTATSAFTGTAPTTTTLGKILYMGFIWNANGSKWDNLAQLNNFT